MQASPYKLLRLDIRTVDLGNGVGGTGQIVGRGAST